MTFWQAFANLFRRKSWDLILLIVVLVVGSIAAVVIGDRYGTWAWGAVGIIALPIAVARVPRSHSRHRAHQTRQVAGKKKPQSKRRAPDVESVNNEHNRR